MKKLLLLTLLLFAVPLTAQIQLGPTGVQVVGVLRATNGGTGDTLGAWQPPTFGSGAPASTCSSSVNVNAVYYNTAVSTYVEYVCHTTWHQSGGGGGGGSLTSVSFAGDNTIFSPATQTITTSGTFIPVLKTFSAHTLLIGPQSGSAVTPTIRGLVASDITPVGTITNNTSGSAASLSNPQTHILGFADSSNTIYVGSQVITSFITPIAQTLSISLSAGGAEIAYTAKFQLTSGTTSSTTFLVKDGGTTVFSIACSGTTCTPTGSPYAIASGHVLSVIAPSSADATAAGLIGTMCANY